MQPDASDEARPAKRPKPRPTIFGSSAPRRVSRRLNNPDSYSSNRSTLRYGYARIRKSRAAPDSDDDDEFIDEGPSYRGPTRTRRAGNQGPEETSTMPRIHGPALEQLVALVQSACQIYSQQPIGTQVWAKLAGFCAWPGVVWSLEHCRTMEVPDVLMSFAAGCTLVHFFGEHSNAWIPTADVHLVQQGTSAHKYRLTGLTKWGKASNRSDLVASTLEELEGACPTPEAEVARVKRLTEVIFGFKFASSELCSVCRQEGAQLACGHCQRSLHPLCLKPPVLSMQHMAKPAPWACPCCGEENFLSARHAADNDASDAGARLARMGLTPDWIIQQAAFEVFQLPQPTAEQPFIKGLLDPCTNSKVAPNIPAELLFDRRDDGLKLDNSWAGHHIILNPPYKSQIQWRFVNRAIDGVEDGSVPAVVLVTRASTDTAYYSRLMPYPRILLRRGVVLFKDYERTPVGFGVALFLIAKAHCRDMYTRFYDAFNAWGEASIPIDKAFMQSDELPLLLERLREHAEKHHRDHWVQCSKCRKWRMISYDALSRIKDEEWTCTLLQPPHSNCDTPQTKFESFGVRYATSGKGDVWCEMHGKHKQGRRLPALRAQAVEVEVAGSPEGSTAQGEGAEALAQGAGEQAASLTLGQGSQGDATAPLAVAASTEQLQPEAQERGVRESAGDVSDADAGACASKSLGGEGEDSGEHGGRQAAGEHQAPAQRDAAAHSTPPGGLTTLSGRGQEHWGFLGHEESAMDCHSLQLGPPVPLGCPDDSSFFPDPAYADAGMGLGAATCHTTSVLLLPDPDGNEGDDGSSWFSGHTDRCGLGPDPLWLWQGVDRQETGVDALSLCAEQPGKDPGSAGVGAGGGVVEGITEKRGRSEALPCAASQPCGGVAPGAEQLLQGSGCAGVGSGVELMQCDGQADGVTKLSHGQTETALSGDVRHTWTPSCVAQGSQPCTPKACMGGSGSRLQVQAAADGKEGQRQHVEFRTRYTSPEQQASGHVPERWEGGDTLMASVRQAIPLAGEGPPGVQLGGRPSALLPLQTLEPPSLGLGCTWAVPPSTPAAPTAGASHQLDISSSVPSLDLARQARMLASKAALADGQASVAKPYLCQAGGVVTCQTEIDRAHSKVAAVQQQLRRLLVEHERQVQRLRAEEAARQQELDQAVAALRQLQPVGLAEGQHMVPERSVVPATSLGGALGHGCAFDGGWQMAPGLGQACCEPGPWLMGHAPMEGAWLAPPCDLTSMEAAGTADPARGIEQEVPVAPSQGAIRPWLATAGVVLERVMAAAVQDDAWQQGEGWAAEVSMDASMRCDDSGATHQAAEPDGDAAKETWVAATKRARRVRSRLGPLGLADRKQVVWEAWHDHPEEVAADAHQILLPRARACRRSQAAKLAPASSSPGSEPRPSLLDLPLPRTVHASAQPDSMQGPDPTQGSSVPGMLLTGMGEALALGASDANQALLGPQGATDAVTAGSCSLGATQTPVQLAAAAVAAAFFQSLVLPLARGQAAAPPGPLQLGAEDGACSLPSLLQAALQGLLHNQIVAQQQQQPQQQTSVPAVQAYQQDLHSTQGQAKGHKMVLQL